MELTKEQAVNLKTFLADNDAASTLGDYSVILEFIDANTMENLAFYLGGTQTDDINEVFAYMMRKGLTNLDSLKDSKSLSDDPLNKQ